MTMKANKVWGSHTIKNAPRNAICCDCGSVDHDFFWLVGYEIWLLAGYKPKDISCRECFRKRLCERFDIPDHHDLEEIHTELLARGFFTLGFEPPTGELKRQRVLQAVAEGTPLWSDGIHYYLGNEFFNYEIVPAMIKKMIRNKELVQLPPVNGIVQFKVWGSSKYGAIKRKEAA